MNSIYTSLQEKEITVEEVAKFRNEQSILNAQIQEHLKEGNRAPIGDGTFNENGYLNARIKILWLMKEPYDTTKNENVENVKTGGWYFSDSKMYKERKFGRDRTTWYPIINASHAILTGQTNWKGSEKISADNKAVSDVLSHIAYINLQKLASLTREKTQNQTIHNAFNQTKPWIQKQFDLLNPDVIICANTLNGAVFEHFGLKGKQILKLSSSEAYQSNDGKLFIRAKHPAQTSIKKSVYINDILSAVETWKKNNK